MLLYTKDRLYPQKEMDFDKVDSGKYLSSRLIIDGVSVSVFRRTSMGVERSTKV